MRFNVTQRTKLFLIAGSVLLLSSIIAGIILLASKQPSQVNDEDENPIVEVPISYAPPIIDEEEDNVPIEESPEDIDYRAQHNALVEQYKNKPNDALLGGMFFYQAAYIKVLADPSTYTLTQKNQNGIELKIHGATLLVTIPYESFPGKYATAVKLDPNRFVEFNNLYRTTYASAEGFNYISHVRSTQQCPAFETSFEPPCSSNTLAFLSESTNLQDYVAMIHCTGTAEACDKAVTSFALEPQYNTESIAATGVAHYMNTKVIARPGSYTMRELNFGHPSSYPVPNTAVGLQYEFYDLNTLINVYELSGGTSPYGGLDTPKKVESAIISKGFENVSAFATGTHQTTPTYQFISNVKNTPCVAGSGAQIPAPCADIDGVKLTEMTSSKNPTYIQLTCKGVFEDCVKSLERVILFVAAKNY